MALKFGPQWLRDLSDGGLNPSQPGTPTMGVKFKSAEYRYGREEMLSLFNDNSPPPDQVKKHLSIFSKEIQKPITLSPLTEDEQRLVSQGFNSIVVLRAAGRGVAPPLRVSRGGGTAERARGRGRGRGEGYIRPENGDVPYSRPPQDGWEHVGRKFERSYSRGYDESGTAKREFSRSSSDNWRDKKHEDEEAEEEGGAAWRNTREPNNPKWGPSSARQNWREPQRDNLGYEGDRRPQLPRRGFDQDSQAAHRTSESYDNDGEVPEWVEDDVGDDPGTFDSSGAFVCTKEGRRYSDTKPEAPNIEGTDKKTDSQHPASQLRDHTPTPESPSSYISDKAPSSQSSDPVYIPPNSRNGTGDAVDSRLPVEQPKLPPVNPKALADHYSVPTSSSNNSGSSNKGDGDSGFAFPNKQETNGTCAPPGQYSNISVPVSLPHPVTVQKSEQVTRTRLTDPEFLHMEKSLQNLVASMTADHRDGRQVDISQGALPLTHENSNKWFYKDPQGEVQGPFTNEEMSQWFSAGFFTMSLVIKRGCDDSFKQLGELIKRYGRVPFLPGPPLPPLITSIPNEPSAAPASPLTIPSLQPSTSGTPLVGPGLPSVPDPLLLQHMLLQQEYLKQTFLMRQMQLQTLHQMQDQDSFKSLNPEQQQHLSMQMMMQTNPVFMQHIQQLQQQQLLLQQQQLQEQQKVSQATAMAENTVSFSQSQPPSSNIITATTTTNNNSGAPDKIGDEGSAWGTIQQYLLPGVWSQATPQPMLQPASLWDIDTTNGTLSPAYLAHLDKLKRERKDEKLKEDERGLQDELEKKQEEIRRQQEDLERQRMQMKREMEELERQRQAEIQKIEESKRLDDERNRQEFERKQQEKAEEKRRAEEEKKRQEEERKREHELKKQEEKKRKEEEKRRQQDDQKRLMAEMRRKKEEDLLRQQELQEQEVLRLQELQNQQLEIQRQREEEERMQREAVERERSEVQKRQQYELQKQQEAMRRLQQAQRDQLANIQLPAASNWAAQQQNVQGSPTQSRSLTEIQEEEARQEQERELEQLQLQAQRVQEQVYLKNVQQQQKSWATQASQGVPSKGVSLLDIQQQEQENAKRTQKDKPNTQTYQAKLAIPTTPTWTGPPSSGTWASNQLSWNSSSGGGSSSFPSSTAVWDQVSNLSNRKSAVKESGEFPALKNQSQQVKKNNDKSSKTKVSGAKQKKEEETVQKLFQTRQQDHFSHWVTEQVSRFCAPIDVSTFVSFIIEVDSPDDVREYMKTYLGDTKESRDFARQFVEKRNHFRNQARLEKQQEEDSIWGPAPAVNPHIQVRGGVTSGGGGGGGSNNSSVPNDGSEGGSGKSKKQKKKQKMQKLDGSILGFTVHADPNRKNAAGEVESVQ